MPTITLTKTQLDHLKHDMDQRTEMLSDAEVNAVAQKAARVVDLPWVSQEQELVVIAKIIKLIDRALYTFLPNEYYALIHDAADGISADEARRLQDRRGRHRASGQGRRRGERRRGRRCGLQARAPGVVAYGVPARAVQTDS